MPTWLTAKSAYVRLLSVDLGAGIVALAELVAVLPALILVRLGVSVPEAFIVSTGAGVLAFWLARGAMALPVGLWSDR